MADLDDCHTRIAELEELLKAKISNLHTSKIAELEAEIEQIYQDAAGEDI